MKEDFKIPKHFLCKKAAKVRKILLFKKPW